MDKDNKYYGVIEQLVRKHRKFKGYEPILDDIIDDVYAHSEAILSNVDNENVINSYLEKVVSTSIITVPKKLNFHTEHAPRTIAISLQKTIEPEIKETIFAKSEPIPAVAELNEEKDENIALRPEPVEMLTLQEKPVEIDPLSETNIEETKSDEIDVALETTLENTGITFETEQEEFNISSEQELENTDITFETEPEENNIGIETESEEININSEQELENTDITFETEPEENNIDLETESEELNIAFETEEEHSIPIKSVDTELVDKMINSAEPGMYTEPAAENKDTDILNEIEETSIIESFDNTQESVEASSEDILTEQSLDLSINDNQTAEDTLHCDSDITGDETNDFDDIMTEMPISETSGDELSLEIQEYSDETEDFSTDITDESAMELSIQSFDDTINTDFNEDLSETNTNTIDPFENHDNQVDINFDIEQNNDSNELSLSNEDMSFELENDTEQNEIFEEENLQEDFSINLQPASENIEMEEEVVTFDLEQDNSEEIEMTEPDSISDFSEQEFDISMAEDNDSMELIITDTDNTHTDSSPVVDGNNEVSYNLPVSKSEINIDSIIESIKNLDTMNPELNILKIYDLKYNKGYKIADMTQFLGMSEENVINALNMMVKIV